MGKVRRVYVEKKPQFAVSAKSLFSEIGSYLGIKGVTGVRVLIRYDIQDVSDKVFKKTTMVVFSLLSFCQVSLISVLILLSSA